MAPSSSCQMCCKGEKWDSHPWHTESLPLPASVTGCGTTLGKPLLRSTIPNTGAGICLRGHHGGLCKGKPGGREQTGPSFSEIPELKTRDRNANVKKLEVFSVSLLNYGDLQATLGSGMGTGPWSLFVLLLAPVPSWPHPPLVLHSSIPWHPGCWHKPVSAQKYHNEWKCQSAGLAWCGQRIDSCHKQKSATVVVVFS